jgi:hypothetical protein
MGVTMVTSHDPAKMLISIVVLRRISVGESDQRRSVVDENVTVIVFTVPCSTCSSHRGTTEFSTKATLKESARRNG